MKRINNIWRFTIFMFMLVVLFPSTVSQTYKFTNLSYKEGFNQNTISSIVKDKNGFLWIGTPNGLIKYDGYDFTEFTWDPGNPFSLRNNFIKYLYSGKKGLLWIVTTTGLEIYDPEKEGFYDVRPDSGTVINRIKEKEDDVLWVLGANHLSFITIDIVNDSIRQKSTPNLLTDAHPNINVYDILSVNDHFHLVGTNHGLFRMYLSDSIKEEIPEVSLDPVHNIQESVNRILREKELVWLGTNNGVFKTFLVEETLHIIDHYVSTDIKEPALPSNLVTDLLMGSDGKLWVGTRYGGLSKYNPEHDRWTNFTYDPSNENGITSSIIKCLLEDDYQVLWIGTAQGGLCKIDFNQKDFITYEHNPFDHISIPGNLVNNIIEDSHGYLWISSYRKPLCRSIKPVRDDNISELAFLRFDEWFQDYPDKNIISLFEDEKGYIWLGYDNSLVIFNPYEQNFHPVHFSEDNNRLPVSGINNILAIDDDRLLIGANPVLLIQDPWNHMIGKSPYTLPVLSNLVFDPSVQMKSLLMDHNGYLWCGTRNDGLFLFDLQLDKLNLLKIFEPGGKSTDHNYNGIFCLYEDADQQIWLGTFGGGLKKVRGSGLDDFYLEHIYINSLGDDAVYGILPENDSVFWLSTDMGLCKFFKNSQNSIIYNVNDGLLNNNYRQNAYYRGKSGYYYFGGLNGLTIFRPTAIKMNIIPPEVSIVNLEINNEKISIGQKINRRFTLDNPANEISHLFLSSQNRSVSFEILIQHSASSHKNRMAYMLEGYDKKWFTGNPGKALVTYMNLPPGKYTFRVNGFNGDGLKSENPRNLTVTVLKPWYKQWWFFSVVSLLILLTGILIFRYLIKIEKLKQSLKFEQKDKLRIQQVNQAKLKFFTNISHEFKSPLTLISAPLQILREKIIQGEQRKYLEIIDKNAKRLIYLIDQLLVFRKIEQEKMDLKLTATNLDNFLYPIAEAFETYSIKNEIHFYHSVKEPDTRISLDFEKMERVIFNLLSNAFKFTPINGTVTLDGRVCKYLDRDFVCFTVTDNGIGIPNDKLEKIFDRFYQIDSDLTGSGTGIGLSYSKSIVELHQGFLKVESEPNKMTRFMVYLPLINPDKELVPDGDIHKSGAKELIVFEELKSSLSYNNSRIPDRSKDTILIVDDEPEVRNIITDILESKYSTIHASNGKEAIDLAGSQNPDLIISDVMMPEMNGFELCKKIKSDLEFCHIPVILLTALDDIDNQILGVEHGADAYLGKPFNLKYLMTTAESLLENRKKIIEHFSQSHSLHSGLPVTNTDKDFIRRVNQIIEENLDNSEFSVEDLATRLAFSQTQLYRKLKQFTGQIPSRYIRNYRLLKAEEKIRKNPWISFKTVMYEVGIESASHFSRIFKDKFGETPSEYAKKLI